MLTIKVCTEDGMELVKEVISVMRRPGSETETGSPCVTYWEARDGDQRAIDVYNGAVYVMNENGKTVADYALYSPENPIV